MINIHMHAQRINVMGAVSVMYITDVLFPNSTLKREKDLGGDCLALAGSGHTRRHSYAKTNLGSD